MLPILRSRFDELERQRRALLDDLGALSAAQLAFRPAPDAWSLVQVIQHLVLVEEGTLRFLIAKEPRPDTRTLTQKIRYRLYRLMVVRDIRIKAPVPSILPTVDATLDALAIRWDAARSTLEQRLEAVTDAQLPMLVHKHVLAGPLTMVETLGVIRLHIVHHGHQVRRIRRASDFPRAGATVPAGAGA